MMLKSSLSVVLGCVILGIALGEEQQQSWQYHQWTATAQGGSSQVASSVPGPQLNVTGSSGPSDAEVNELIEQILSSGRQGRNVDGLDDVYSDPTIQDALNSGDDAQARNLIKDKLCSLGLMQCDEYSIEGKRPSYYRPHPPPNYNGPPRPNGPLHYNGPPPSTNHNGPYGPPKPMPVPGPTNFNGPPRKVGYGGPSGPIKGPFYSSPSFSSPSFGPTGPVYLSKPLDPIYEGPPSISPYEFEAPGKLSLDHGSSIHKPHHDSKPSPTIVVNAHGGAATNDGTHGARLTGDAIQQHVHHHYHHGEGDVKVPTVVVNPVHVPVPIAHGNSINEFSSSGSSFQGSNSFSNAGGFTPMSSSYGFSGKQQLGVNSIGGLAGVNGGLEQSVNGVGGSGIYGSGGLNSYQSSKPVFESGQGLPTGLGNQGPATFGSQTNYGQSVSGIYSDSTNSFHSTNPDFYKKELSVNGAKNQNGISQYSQAAYLQQQQGHNQFNNGADKYQFDRKENGGECVCVAYEQCPAQDVLGRKDDLILPLDPRNLDKNIEAVSEDNTDGNSTLKVVKHDIEKKTDVVEAKKITKRDVSEVAEKKSNDGVELEQADGEARLLGLGGLGGLGGGIGGPVGLGGKKHVVPTFGVSFGLPYPSGAYPLNPYSTYPAQNPYFGAISPNGLNLGLLNVNPLVSFQVSKNEYGEKLLKPLVNLHVTPNENIINKVGSFLHAKKEGLFGGGGGHYGSGGHINQHYHTHTHLSEPPAVYHPHHHSLSSHHHHPHGSDFYSTGPYNGGNTYPTGPNYASESLAEYYGNGLPTGPYGNGQISGLSENYGGGYGYTTGLANYYRENTGPESSPLDYDPNNNYYSRSANFSQSDLQANNYQSTNIQNLLVASPENSNNYAQTNHQQNSRAEGASRNVAFPTSRRRRDAQLRQDVDPNAHEERSLNAEKRQYFGMRPSFNNQIQQCGPRQVCCRRPVRQPQQLQRGPQCGTRNSQGINGRIKNPVYVDGDSEFGEYPWQVAILKKDPKESVYACGGTVIDHLHIITAAHCIKSYGSHELRVRLGEWDVNHDVEFYPYIERDVVQVHIHPEYYAGTLDNDMAILRMDRPVDFSQYPHISPACLPDKFTDFTGTRCWTTGWGKDAFGDYGKYQNILKEVDVPIIGDLQCQQQLRQTRLGYNYKLNPGFICAGGEEGKDACKGDGGGPLVCERNGSWSLVGVVSWGIGCGQVNVPGVYARVAYYLDWIQQITHQF